MVGRYAEGYGTKLKSLKYPYHYNRRIIKYYIKKTHYVNLPGVGSTLLQAPKFRVVWVISPREKSGSNLSGDGLTIESANPLMSMLNSPSFLHPSLPIPCNPHFNHTLMKFHFHTP